MYKFHCFQDHCLPLQIRINLECLILAIQISCSLFALEGLSKFGMPNFGHSKFLPVFLYQNGFNKFGMLIFGHSEFIPVFWEKLLEKFGTAIIGHSEFILVFLGKIVGKIWNSHYWPF